MESALTRSFLICSYPRSRTLWFSRFLTIPRVCFCAHEASEYASCSQEFWANAKDRATILETPIFGNSDSAQLFVLPALLAANPTTRAVWIDRPIEEVAESLIRAGFPPLDQQVKETLRDYRDHYLDLFDLVVSYSDLGNPVVIENIWRLCLGDEIPFSVAWWKRMDTQRIAYSIPANPPHARDNTKFHQFLMFEMERRPWLTQQSSEH
jgi:hypothetical protein